MKSVIRLTILLIVTSAMFIVGCSGLLGAGVSVTHTITPINPAFTQLVTDCNTGALVTPNELIQPPIGCDGWNANRYERPFNDDSQDEYLPDLDILQAQLGTGAGWFFLSIELYDLQEGEDSPQGTYAIEIDLDQDHRGDALILAEKPVENNGEWQVAGVQVWEDTDQTVGNEKPSVADHPFEDDGYDKLLFGPGSDSPDPDVAWSRFVSGDPPVVEIAFKASLINNDPVFIWWVWAQQSMDPEIMDYHDSIKHQDAGDVYLGMPYYPSDEINRTDNTCRALWGAPSDDNPTLCVNDPFVPHPTPGAGTPTYTPPANLTATATLEYLTGTPTIPNLGSLTPTSTNPSLGSLTPSPTFEDGGCKDDAGGPATCTSTPENPTSTPTLPCERDDNNPCTPTPITPSPTLPCSRDDNNPCTPTPTPTKPPPRATSTPTETCGSRANPCTPTPCPAAPCTPTSLPD